MKAPMMFEAHFSALILARKQEQEREQEQIQQPLQSLGRIITITCHCLKPLRAGPPLSPRKSR